MLKLQRFVSNSVHIYFSSLVSEFSTLLLEPIQCSNCYSNTAVYWCDRCGNSYCSECSTIVHAPPALQNHRPVAINEKLPEIASCLTHTDEKLKYWCHACDILVCRDCLLFEHKEHHYALMDQVARKLKSEVSFQFCSYSQ